jgi:uncharacterized protein (TIGR00251 family)
LSYAPRDLYMTLRVKVIPRSARSELAGELADGTLKVKIAAPPERGQANLELCRFLAQHFGVDRGAVTILSGHTGTRKLVRISGQ